MVPQVTFYTLENHMMLTFACAELSSNGRHIQNHKQNPKIVNSSEEWQTCQVKHLA